MKEYKQLLIEENNSLIEALTRLEKTKKKILFVVSNGKLVAALADGDVRRWLISEGKLDAMVRDFANYNPIFVYEDKKDEAFLVMRKTYSDVVPIVNYNMEILDIVTSASILVEEEKISDKIPVVINAGGKGTRLYPYTKILPKALIPIGEIPVSEHIVNRFEEIGAKEFYMIVNEKKEMIKAYYSNSGYHLTLVEESVPLGTGGGLSLLRDKIKSTFIFINCDTIILADFAKIIRKHYEKKNFITIVCAEKSFEIPYGVVKSNKEEFFMGITEKPQMNFQTNVGCYIVEPDFLKLLPQNTAVDFPDAIVRCKEQGYNIGVYAIDEEEWLDMGQFHTLEDMKKRLRVE